MIGSPKTRPDSAVRNEGSYRASKLWLSALFDNPAFVLTIGALLLGTSILAANEQVIREERVRATRGVEQRVEALTRTVRDQVESEIAALDTLLRMTSGIAQREGLEVAAVRMARMVAARAGKSAYFFLLNAQGEKVWESAALELDQIAVARHLTTGRQPNGSLQITPVNRMGGNERGAYMTRARVSV